MNNKEFILKYFNEGLSQEELQIFKVNIQTDENFATEVKETAKMLVTLKAVEKMPSLNTQGIFKGKRFLSLIIISIIILATIFFVNRNTQSIENELVTSKMPEIVNNNDSSGTIDYERVIQSESKLKQKPVTLKMRKQLLVKENNHNIKEWNGYTYDYGDFVYEKKSIKERDTSKIELNTDCGKDIYFVSEHGTTLVMPENSFYPINKSNIRIRFKELNSITELVNSDFLNLSSLDGYLGISNILFISAVDMDGKQSLEPNFRECTSKFHIFIPVNNNNENLLLFKFQTPGQPDSTLKEKFFYENDSTFFEFQTDELSAYNLAVFEPSKSNDIQIILRDKLWSPIVINVLCYNENDNLSYTGIKNSEGRYSFPAVLKPKKTILYLKFNYKGNDYLYKNRLSNMEYSAKTNSYSVSKKQLIYLSKSL